METPPKAYLFVLCSTRFGVEKEISRGNEATLTTCLFCSGRQYLTFGRSFINKRQEGAHCNCFDRCPVPSKSIWKHLTRTFTVSQRLHRLAICNNPNYGSDTPKQTHHHEGKIAQIPENHTPQSVRRTKGHHAQPQDLIPCYQAAGRGIYGTSRGCHAPQSSIKHTHLVFLRVTPYLPHTPKKLVTQHTRILMKASFAIFLLQPQELRLSSYKATLHYTSTPGFRHRASPEQEHSRNPTAVCDSSLHSRASFALSKSRQTCARINSAPLSNQGTPPYNSSSSRLS